MVSAVMFGALAGSGAFPTRDACEAAIRAGGRGAAASLAGSRMGFAAGAPGRPRRSDSSRCTLAAEPVPSTTDSALAQFPEAVREFVALGRARAEVFQDRAYGTLYLERVARVLAAERSSRLPSTAT